MSFPFLFFVNKNWLFKAFKSYNQIAITLVNGMAFLFDYKLFSIDKRSIFKFFQFNL